MNIPRPLTHGRSLAALCVFLPAFALAALLQAQDFTRRAPSSWSKAAAYQTRIATLVRQPYLQQVTATSARVVWATAEDAPSYVTYAPAGGTTTPTTVQARTTLARATTTGLPADYYQHEAALENLSPLTRYAYDIVSNTVDLNPQLDTLTTAPAPGAGTVSFVAFGDSGIGSTGQQQVAAQLDRAAFDFALHTGDLVYGTAETTGGATHQTMDAWFFQFYRDWLRSRAMFPSMGNHDSRASNGDGRPYKDLFVLPAHGATATYPDHAERYYSFDYGPVHVVVLDTELAFQDPARRQAQLSWLESDLARTTQPWKIAVFHRSPYSAGGEHGSDLVVRAAFAPVFDRYGLQLALSAHEHTYERTLPLRADAPNAAGTTYVVTGGGGARLYSAGTDAWTAASASVHHYVRGTASDCTLQLDAIDADGREFDGVSLTRCPPPPDTIPPTITLTAPPDGAHLTAPATATISATASDRDGGITQVAFYAGTTLLGSDTTAPYQITWRDVPAGSYRLTASATDNAGAVTTSAPVTVTVRGATGPVPPPWTAQDIGAVGVAGGTAYEEAGTFWVAGGGADIWGTADAFHYVWQPLGGDGDIVARVATVEAVHSWTKAGVMIRERLTADSPHALMLVSPSNGLAFQRRRATAGLSTSTSGGGGRPPAWVKLERRGTTISAFRSADGRAWTLVGRDTFTMGATVYAGLAVVSHDTTRLATATLDGVSVTAPQTPPPNAPPVVALTAPANNAQFTAPATITIAAAASDSDGGVAQVAFYEGTTLLGSDSTAPYEFAWTDVPAGTYTLSARATDTAGAATTSAPVTVTVTGASQPPGAVPAPWTAQDIGAVGVTGRATHAAGTFTVAGGGADIWGSADGFQYVWQPLSGDGDVVARVATVEAVHAWTKAGVMIRERLTADSPHALMLVSPSNGLAFQRRRATAGASTNTSGGSGQAPGWVKLERRGTTISAFRSADGQTWTLVGRDTFTMGATVYAGLAVVSHDTTRLATATFDGVSVTAPVEPAGVPPPWTAQDIGAVGITGRATHTAGTFTVAGGGADIWGSADAFHYVWQPLSGDGDVVARVASLDPVHAWTKAGVMIRERLTADSPHALMLVSAGNGLAFQRRRATAGVSAHTGGGSGRAPAWVKLERRGTTISAFRSSDGATWTLVGRDTFTMGATVYAGLAIVSHDASRLATGTFDGVSVTAR